MALYLSLSQTLYDLDRVPVILESLRTRSLTAPWLLRAEEWASKAKYALEQLTVYYEDENEDEPYKEPIEFRLLTLLDKHLELLMASEDLQKLFRENLKDIEMVELLISFIDPSAEDNYAIRKASQNGYIEVVDRLLTDRTGRVDPSACNNNAILWASHNGHGVVVDRLLQDERVDPSACNNWPIQSASERGHVAVVERLLQDNRVDPSAHYNSAIRWASLFGHVAVVELLKAHGCVIPTLIQTY